MSRLRDETFGGPGLLLVLLPWGLRPRLMLSPAPQAGRVLIQRTLDPTLEENDIIELQGTANQTRAVKNHCDVSDGH